MATLTFCGATGTVTGSRFVLEHNGFRLLVDCDLCGILWPDSGHLQEEDARFANRRGHTKHKPALPLYTEQQARTALGRLRPRPFDHTLQVHDEIEIRFYPAGHILGAAFVEVRIDKGHGVRKTVLFSGDLGRPDQPILPDPTPLPRADLLLLESTYGNRDHPAEAHDLEMRSLVANGEDPLGLRHVHLDATVDQSKALNDLHYPSIIISASGMATGGRALHHLAYRLGDHRTTVLFVGYQAAGTRVRAHADRGEIMGWLGAAKRPPGKIYLVHGEPTATDALADRIREQTSIEVHVPNYLQKVEI